jgi:plastocyanin
LAPGVTQGYVTLSLVAVPSSLASASELVRLNYSAPRGISVKFAYDSVKIGSDSRLSVPLTLAVSQSMAPGDYALAIQGNSGTQTENYTLMVRVVQYLVYMTDNSFTPNNITVRPGSTVFWMNLDPSIGPYPVIHTVTFTTGTTAHSSGLRQYEWYSFTFTATGNYSYHCEFHPQVMNAIVSVSPG